jgi:hypothetical protein
MLFFRFWRSALAWTAAMVALSLANSTFANFTGPYSHEPAVLLALFGGTLNSAARYLPIAAFAAGISVATGLAAPRARLHLLLALASVGAAVFLLYAYVGPWLHQVGMVAYLDATGVVLPEPMPPQNRPFLYSIYRDFVAQGKGDFFGMGFRHHLQVTASFLAAVMAALGVWVGRWTEGTGDRVRSTIQRWLAGLGLVAAVYTSLQFGFRLSIDGGVDPTLAASGILVVPVVVLLAAAWTQWVAGGSAAPGQR